MVKDFLNNKIKNKHRIISQMIEMYFGIKSKTDELDYMKQANKQKMM